MTVTDRIKNLQRHFGLFIAGMRYRRAWIKWINEWFSVGTDAMRAGWDKPSREIMKQRHWDKEPKREDFGLTP